MRQKRPIYFTLLRLALLLTLVPAALLTMPAAPGGNVAHAATNILTLRVESARQWIPAGLNKGDAIPHYHWLVVQDDTGDPTHYPGSETACKPQSLGGDPDYPANCQWPAIHSVKGGTSAEVVAQGDETTLNETTGIDTTTWPANDHNPNRSYMISVMAEGFDITTGCTIDATHNCHVDGFKIDGAWFNSPVDNNGLVTVAMQPYPLPLLTVRMAVWNDIQTNGAYDTGEPNLQGFEGHIDDVLGAVTTDWYGNPLCTTYQHDGDGLMLIDADGKPLIDHIGGHCYSDANGVISIPYLGPNRYASTVTPPDGQVWYQTSTLEGWHDWDTWSIEGWNGYDPEFVQGAEPFPFAEFGFVQLQHGASATACCNYSSPASTGSIKGTVVGISEYSPQVGGLTLAGGQGKNIIENINQPLVSLIDTGRDDTTVYVGRGDANGKFNITNIPDGDYVLTFWDEDQAYLLTEANVSIQNGQALDMGDLDVAAWHSQVYGKVCFDTDRDGKCGPDDAGISGLALNLLDRDNKVAFYGDNTATTDNDGNYRFPRTYPLGQWVVTQGYWEQYYTVGVTYQTENQPEETTVLANGGFVDVSSLNLIGHQTRMDWAIHTYETPNHADLGPTNGGIAGEVVATTTRNELDARFQAIESYEPGLPDATVHLYAPVKCVPTDSSTIPAGTNCTLETTAFGSSYYLTDAVDGSIKKLSDGLDKVSGNPIDLTDPYTTETWTRPTDCVARGPDGTPVVEQVLPLSTGGHDCLEAPLMSSQVGDNSVGDFMSVNGNFGFGSITVDPATGGTISEQPLKPGDYLVEVEAPQDANGNPAYEIVKEEDINIFSGDQFVAPGETPFPVPTPNRTPPTPVVPAIPPFPCAGAQHTVHVVADSADAQFDLLDPANPAKTGVYNPDMVDGGGSPYEGQQKPLCSTQLVTVRNGRSATPGFHFKTFSGFDTTDPQNPVPLPAGAGVPLPGRIFGIVVDDLNLSTNPQELFYGEKYGIPSMPVGIYDFSNRLVKTIQTDPQGQYEVILPSTSSYNCPLPAGPCPGIYRFLANDPGQPGHLNPGYNAAYRTIGAFFEVWPGVSLPSDLAPTPVAFGIENPGTQQAHPAACLLNDPANTTDPAVPELFSVSKPFVRSTDSGAARRITINGQYFGASAGTVTLTSAAGTATTLALFGAWSDTQITVVIPSTTGSGSIAAGPYQLKITGSNGQSTVNGLTIHVLSGNGSSGSQNPYNPTVYQVGPGLTGANTFDPNAASHNTGGYEHAIQDALDAAANSNSTKLVVVYPGSTSTFNPFGSYFENIVIHSPVKLQGVGPGGLRGNTHIPGTVLDGLGYGTDGARETGWQATINSLVTAAGGIVGPNGTVLNDPDTAVVPEGEVILSVARSANQYTTGYQAAIDGLTVQNGDVMDFVPNVNSLGNGSQVGGGNNTPTNPNQGGGVVALASTRYLQITNNIIRSNAGAYGAIRLGTPLVGDNHLDGAHIANNRILNNGGSNLAGAVGIFNGTYGYEINNNDLCGNFSAEYGGAISHFGLDGSLNSSGNRATNGTPPSIHDNRIYFNGSYDEGGGVIVAGEPPTNPNTFGAGAGPVNIYNNIIEANMANDDGGGLRFLTAGNFPYNVYNNMIVNNISTHEGGGVAIDNAPNVRFYNNTVMKNLTTATAATSNGLPAPAGLSTALNSSFLQATLPGGSPLYSNPLLFNNIFWDNRAGSWNGANVVGIGGLVWIGGVQVPDPTPINYWDMGVPGTGSQLSPTNSVLTSNANPGVTASATNSVGVPATLATDPYVNYPQINTPFDTSVAGLPWRGNPNFVANVIVAQDVPISIMGDYHLSATTSPAFNLGAASKAVPSYQQPPNPLAAPTTDIDHDQRPSGGGYDAGADEIGPAAIAFPAAGVLDNFDRANSNSVGTNWRGNLSGFYTILSNQARVVNSGYMWWCGSGAGSPNSCTAGASNFGANQEAYFTFAKVVSTASEQDLLLKVNNFSASGGGVGTTTSLIEVQYDATTSQVLVNTYCGSSVAGCGSQSWRTRAVFGGVTFAPGDQFGARTTADGTVVVYKNGAAIGSTIIPTAGANAWPAALASGGGRVGVWFIRSGGFGSSNDARFDNFGGGTLP
jgi:IPT/TIG domain